MTSSCMFMKSGWITANAPLRNGIGRFIPQLARITLKFCKSDGSSQGVRQFIQQDVVQFAKQNPHCVVYLKPRRHRSPILVAEYLNGERHWMSLHNMSLDEVSNWVDVYRTSSGAEFMSQPKMQYSDHPSVQGTWHPHVHSQPREALATYPCPELSQTRNTVPAASDILRQLEDLDMAKLIKKLPAMMATTKEVAVPKLNTFWRYAKVELAPPSPADIPVAIADMSTKIANAQKQTFRSWTVNQAVVNTVVGIEVFCWFFVGECIGKGSLAGYQV